MVLLGSSVLFFSVLILLRSTLFGAGQSLNETLQPLSYVPEHGLTLGKVVMSVSTSSADLSLQHPLLSSLPGYTKIFLLLPATSTGRVEKWLKDKPYAGQIILLPFETALVGDVDVYLLFPEREKLVWGTVSGPTPLPKGSTWAQDLFQVVVASTETRVVLPDAYKMYFSRETGTSTNLEPDNGFLDSMRKEFHDVRRSMLAFSGGNVILDRRGEENIVLIGNDLIRKTTLTWNGTYREPKNDESIVSVLRRTFEADRVVIVGSGDAQPSLLFHLDQAMVLLDEGVAGVTRIVGKVEPEYDGEITQARGFLDDLRKKLSALSYEVVDIDTTVEHVLARQFFVNAVAYTDKNTRQKTILMPVFGGGKEHRDFEEKNKNVFEKLGYQVVPVKSQSYRLNGGIHCLLNVLE